VTFPFWSQLPVPAKCSQQFRKLIHSHSLTQPVIANAGAASGGVVEAAAAALASPSPSASPDAYGAPKINQPQLPLPLYSPYGSPSSSPRVKRKPLRETKRVDSVTRHSDDGGEFVELNQYKLEGVVGQVSYNGVRPHWRFIRP